MLSSINNLISFFFLLINKLYYIMANSGKITQIIGPVVDVAFEKENTLPEILNALEIPKDDGSSLTLEVQQHLR